MSEKRPISQATIIGQAPPQTWQELARDCKLAFGGGYHTAVDRAIFNHGMQTAFNLIDGEFPPLADARQLHAALASLAGLRIVAERLAEQIKCLLVLCESYEGDAGWKPEGCEGCIEERCGPYLALAAYGALTKEQATTTEESEDG